MEFLKPMEIKEDANPKLIEEVRDVFSKSELSITAKQIEGMKEKQQHMKEVRLEVIIPVVIYH